MAIALLFAIQLNDNSALVLSEINRDYFTESQTNMNFSVIRGADTIWGHTFAMQLARQKRHLILLGKDLSVLEDFTWSKSNLSEEAANILHRLFYTVPQACTENEN